MGAGGGLLLMVIWVKEGGGQLGRTERGEDACIIHTDSLLLRVGLYFGFILYFLVRGV